MDVGKTFTLSEAQTMLRVLEALLRKAQAAASRVDALGREMQELSYRIFLAGGMQVDVTVAARRRAERDKAEQETKDTLAEIHGDPSWRRPHPPLRPLTEAERRTLGDALAKTEYPRLFGR